MSADTPAIILLNLFSNVKSSRVEHFCFWSFSFFKSLEFVSVNFLFTLLPLSHYLFQESVCVTVGNFTLKIREINELSGTWAVGNICFVLHTLK